MSTDIAEKNQGVTKAAAAVRQAETDLAAGAGDLSASALHRLRDNYRHARLSAEGARAKAERDRESARVAALEELGRQVDTLSMAGTPGELGDELRIISDACTRARVIVSAWDTSVRDLVQTGADLAVDGMAPGGPARASGYLAIKVRPGDQSIAHHRVQLTAVGIHLARAIERAVLGHPDDGLLLVNGVNELPEPPRPKFVVRATRSGTITALYVDKLDDGMKYQIKNGDLKLLGPDEVERWLRGELA